MDIASAHMEKLEGVDQHLIAVIDGVECQVPISGGNRHYREIMDQVEAGTLVLGEPVDIVE